MKALAVFCLWSFFALAASSEESCICCCDCCCCPDGVGPEIEPYVVAAVLHKKLFDFGLLVSSDVAIFENTANWRNPYINPYDIRITSQIDRRPTKVYEYLQFNDCIVCFLERPMNHPSDVVVPELHGPKSDFKSLKAFFSGSKERLLTPDFKSKLAALQAAKLTNKTVK